MATALPSSSTTCNTSIKNKIVVSKYNCVSNASNLIELNLNLMENNINSDKSDKSDLNNDNKLNENCVNNNNLNDNLNQTANDKFSRDKLAVNGLNNQLFTETNLQLANKSEMDSYLSSADADAKLYQKKKSAYLNELKLECNEINLNKKIRNGEYCIKDNDLDSKLDKQNSNVDSINNSNVDNELNDEQMNKRNLIKNNLDQVDCRNSLVSSCSNCDNKLSSDEQIKDEQLNDEQSYENNENKNEFDSNSSNYRKESITEQMDTDNELFTKELENDKSLTEDEQMDISQCDQLKSIQTTASTNLFNNKQNSDDNHLINGESYSSSLCSTPSELSTDVDVYIDSNIDRNLNTDINKNIDPNEQMDTTNQLDLKKKSVKEILSNDVNVNNKKQCSMDKENDREENNQIDDQFKDQSKINSEIKDDNLSSSDTSDKSSNNNSTTRLPDEVSILQTDN